MRPELVNRLGNIVLFKPLGLPHLTRLLGRLEGELNSRLRPKGLKISIGQRLAESLASMAKASGFGGRALQRLFERYVIDDVSERLIRLPGFMVGAWRLETDGDGLIEWRLDLREGHYLTSNPEIKTRP
jgi:ATP-dependent Clp protease ATP-binding subunit ClpA